MKKIISVLAIIALLFSLAACGNASNKIVGNWAFESGDEQLLGESCAFREDGTGSVNGVSFNWHINGDTLTCSTMFGTDNMQFKISGKTLIVDDSSGDTSTYKRVG